MRIISLSPAVTETIFAFGGQKHLVGVTYFCNYPREAKKLPKVGSFSNADVARIKKLRPNLVITQTIVQEKSKELFKRESIPHLHLDPRRLGDIYENIMTIGKVIGAYKKAELLITQMRLKEKQLRVKYSSSDPKRSEGESRSSRQARTIIKRRLSVYVEEWWDPPMASGNWVPDIIKLAGGVSFMPNSGATSRKVSVDEIYSFNPDLVLLAYCGFGEKSDPKKILSRKGWGKIAAIKNGKIFAVDEEILNRPGPRILSAVDEIASYMSH